MAREPQDHGILERTPSTQKRKTRASQGPNATERRVRSNARRRARTLERRIERNKCDTAWRSSTCFARSFATTRTDAYTPRGLGRGRDGTASRKQRGMKCRVARWRVRDETD
eukprot:scaffold408_cov347-Pavlova_lutheri.AAC.25